MRKFVTVLLVCSASCPAAEIPIVPPAPAVYDEWEAAAKKMPAGGAGYRNDPNNHSRRTDHFIFRWGTECRGGFIHEDLAQGHLQMLEHAYRTWQEMGLRGLGGQQASKGRHYKAVIAPWESFAWQGAGGAVGFMEGPGVAGTNVPTNALAYLGGGNGCTPHELGHGWQNQGGLPGSQPPGHSESLANWYMHLFLVEYPALMPAVGVTPNHACQNYNQYAFFDHFLDRPGFGADFINRLVFAPNLNSMSEQREADDLVRKAIRVDTSAVKDRVGHIMDELGFMNARMLDMDFWNRDYDRAFACTKDAKREFFFYNRAALVRQAGVDGEWWRPQWMSIPQAGGAAYIPLAVTATGSRRTVTCDLRPTAEATLGGAYRAMFVALTADGRPRYGRLWNAGENRFVLADDEQAVYLAVTAHPQRMAWSIRNNDYTGGLTGEAPRLFPFRLRLTGAQPRWFSQPAPSDAKRHANGGGLVAATAQVDASAYVGPEAKVLGKAKVVGKARIEDHAVISGSATVGSAEADDRPVVSGYAYVTDEAVVRGRAKVRDQAWIGGKAQVFERAAVMGFTRLRDNAKVHGDAVLVQCQLRDPGLAFHGDYHGHVIRGGDLSGDGTYDRRVWVEFTDEEDAKRRDAKVDQAGQYLGYTFERPSTAFALDEFGMFHSYLMGEPKATLDRIANVETTVMSFDGRSSAIELRPEALDRRATTIALWVKWNGGAADQRIFSCGDGAKKAVWLTPKSSQGGKLRLSISDGERSRTLDAPQALPVGTWVHVAVTFTNGGASVWIDGKSVAEDRALAMSPDDLHAPFLANANFLGRGPGGGWFAGSLDEVRIFVRPLAQADLAKVMQRVVPVSNATPDTSATGQPTWLVEPTVESGRLTGSNLVMSLAPVVDPSGVLYRFFCAEDQSLDSGWLSEPRYITGRGEPGRTYSFTASVRDGAGNVGGTTGVAKVTLPSADRAAPTLPTPAFTAEPRGSADGEVTMTAALARDADDLVLYRFTRSGTTVSSGWTSSRTWTDRGLMPSARATYTVEVMDGYGNASKASVASAPATPRDDTPPPLAPVRRMQWEAEPFVQTDGTVRMSARATLFDNQIEFQFACVEKPEISGTWSTRPVWISPALPAGRWTFRYQVRDASPQRNTSAWSMPAEVRIGPTNTYSEQPLAKLASLPDSTLVRFSGTVMQVKTDRYLISDGKSTIDVLPRSFARRTEPGLLTQSVEVEGHLWTYTGGTKQVTYARVVPVRVASRIECENGRLLNGASPRYLEGASFQEVIDLGDEQVIPPAVELTGLAAAKEFTLFYHGGERVNLYLNGTLARELKIQELDPSRSGAAVVSLDIPAGATLRFERIRNAWPPQLDCIVLGRTQVVSGRVTGMVKASPGQIASVRFSPGADPLTAAEYRTRVDDKGAFKLRMPAGKWFAAALTEHGAVLQASPVQTVVISGDRQDLSFPLAWSAGRRGLIEAESGLRKSPATIDPHRDASGGMCVGNLWDGSVSFTNVGPAKRVRIRYGSPGSGTYGLYVNGVRQTIQVQPSGGYFTFKDMSVDVAIPEHATLMLKKDPGDGSWNVDCLTLE